MKKPFLNLLLGLALTSVCCAASADFVVIVNPKNPVTAISKDQIAQYFLGATNTFSPVDLPENSPLRVEFYKVIADKDPSQVRSIWAKLVFTGKARPARQVETSEAVKQLVISNINAIGYIEKSAADASVKVVFSAN